VRTPVTIDVEIEQLACVCCAKTTIVEPLSFRRREFFEMQHDSAAAPWRTDSSRTPDGWHRWHWPGDVEAAACGACWEEVKVRAALFAHGLQRDLSR
jgi:hypothetical protein